MLALGKQVGGRMWRAWRASVTGLRCGPIGWKCLRAPDKMKGAATYIILLGALNSIVDRSTILAYAGAMNTRQSRRPGRPPSNPLSRSEQLRVAKRAQRSRERAAGMQVIGVKLSGSEAERLRLALHLPGFEKRLTTLLDEELVDVSAFANLAALCWNRRERYLGAAEAFRLYERNWRLVDRRHMQRAERELIQRLAGKYGNGVLNV